MRTSLLLLGVTAIAVAGVAGTVALHQGALDADDEAPTEEELEQLMDYKPMTKAEADKAADALSDQDPLLRPQKQVHHACGKCIAAADAVNDVIDARNTAVETAREYHRLHKELEQEALQAANDARRASAVIDDDVETEESKNNPRPHIREYRDSPRQQAMDERVSELFRKAHAMGISAMTYEKKIAARDLEIADAMAALAACEQSDECKPKSSSSSSSLSSQSSHAISIRPQADVDCADLDRSALPQHIVVRAGCPECEHWSDEIDAKSEEIECQRLIFNKRSKDDAERIRDLYGQMSSEPTVPDLKIGQEFLKDTLSGLDPRLAVGQHLEEEKVDLRQELMQCEAACVGRQIK